MALGAATFGVVLASLAIGAHEVDRLALERQRATMEQAIDQHGLALARELRVQSVWNEGYLHVHANDVPWMHKYYGTYLNQLLGYDRIYIISGTNEPVYGFVAADPQGRHSFDEIAPGLKDLIGAARDHTAKLPDDNVLNTDIALGNGLVAHHRAVADVRSIEGRPATVVISTIVPDHSPPDTLEKVPYLLVAVEDLDKEFTSQLGTNFGFRGLQWITGEAPPAPTPKSSRRWARSRSARSPGARTARAWNSCVARPRGYSWRCCLSRR
ncbi:MAG: CHASE4 domain-containing protein [Hyphomicrobium sp.]